MQTVRRQAPGFQASQTAIVSISSRIIHRMTARQTSPTADCSVRGGAVVSDGHRATVSSGQRIEARRLGKRTAQARAQRAAAGGEQHAIVCLRPLTRVIAPRINGIFEIADDREAQRRQACRHPVDHEEDLLREV